ncbi:MAG TPA: P-loop NTPase [Gaiellaceae bacterium]|nr:P-loop NTPase [Gaiellaceae bacterium]
MPYWHALRSHRLLIVAVTAIALLAALAVVETATKRYDASADLGINPLPAFGGADPRAADPALFSQPADGSPATVRPAKVLGSPEYLGKFYASRSYQKLPANARDASITVTPLSQADIVAIQVSASTPQLAESVANRFANFVITLRNQQFRRWLRGKIVELKGELRSYPTQSQQHQNLAGTLTGLQYFKGPDTTVSLVTKATAPTAAAWPRPKQTLGVALVVGLLLGLAAAIALEVISPRFTREEELTQAHRLPVLARIPRLPARAVEGYFLGRGPLPREAWKAYRTLRAVLATAGENGNSFPSSIAVTSAGPGDGKTLTAVNLAIALSSAGLNVTLVDADLPRPMVGTIFNVVGHRDGVVHLLNNPAAPRTGAIPAPLHARLQLLLASEEQMHELQLFDTQRVKQLLDRLGRESDVVVIDTPPLPEVAEAVAFADAAEAVVVCVRIGHTRRDKLADLRELLGRRRVSPLGFFITARRGPGRSAKGAYQGYPGDLPVIPGDYLLSPEEPSPSSSERP